MNKSETYTYVVLRYVHDVVSSEFVNVGVVLLSPNEGKLKFKTRKTVGRIKHVFPDLDRSAFVVAMRSVEKGLRSLRKHASSAGMFASNENVSSYALQALPRDDSSLQWSEIGSGLSSNTNATLERLFERHVGKYDTKPVKRRSDDDVWRPVRDSLKQRGVQLLLQPKTVVGNSDSIEFGKAWKNGSWHAYEALSMDLADADGIKDKARRWRGHLDAVADGNVESVQLKCVLGRPKSPTLLPAFENAKNILAGSAFDLQVFDEEEVGQLVDQIEDAYRAHEGDEA